MTSKTLVALLTLLTPVLAYAQEPEMADQFRGEGKIYIVVGIVVLILLGLSIYLFLTDKRLKKLEDEFHSNQSNK